MALAACDVGTGRQDFSYKITPDGGPTSSDHHTYETLGEQSITKMQKYQIVVQGDGEKPFHFLVVNITKKLGDKVIDSSKGVALPVQDGIYNFECTHSFYDLKLSKSLDEIDSPTCEFEMVGVMVPNARATKVAAKEAK